MIESELQRRLTPAQLEIIDNEEPIQWVIKDRRLGVTTAIAIKAIRKAMTGIPTIYLGAGGGGVRHFVRTAMNIAVKYNQVFSYEFGKPIDISNVGSMSLKIAGVGIYGRTDWLPDGARGFSDVFIALDEVSVAEVACVFDHSQREGRQMLIAPYLPGNSKPLIVMGDSLPNLPI